MRKANLFQHRERHGKNGFIIHFDVYGIVPRLLKLEIVNLVDEIDTLDRAVRFKIPGENLPLFLHWETHADGECMLSGFAVGQRNEPNHLRVSKRELAGFDLGKDAQKGLFAGYWIYIDAVTGKPGKKLWFGTQKTWNWRGEFLVGGGKQTAFAYRSKSEGLT